MTAVKNFKRAFICHQVKLISSNLCSGKSLDKLRLLGVMVLSPTTGEEVELPLVKHSKAWTDTLHRNILFESRLLHLDGLKACPKQEYLKMPSKIVGGTWVKYLASRMDLKV